MESMLRSKGVQRAGVVMGVIVAVGSRILDGVDIVQLGLPFWAWEAIGLAVFLVAIAAVAYGHEIATEPSSEKLPNGTSGDRQQVTFSGVEFYPHRQATEWYSRQLEQAERASVSWNTGSILRDSGVLEERKENLERVILPHPLNINLEPLAEAAHDSREEVVDKIKKVTRDLIDHKIDVRWRYGLPTNLMTVCNEWILVESFFPHLSASDRPQWRIHKDEHPELYKRLRAVYDGMWAESAPPPLQGSAEWL